MFSRRKRNQRKKFQYNPKQILSISILILLFVLLASIIFYIWNTIQIRKAFENQIASYEKQGPIFSFDKIILFHSADAKRNDTQRAIWDLDLYQYTDIAIYLNNHSEQGLNDNNTISKLWIDSISLASPSKGTVNLSAKSVAGFGKFSLAENSSPESISYSIEDSSSDLPDNPLTLYHDNSLPITLEYQNLIQKNLVLSNLNNTPLAFDGTLLKKALVPISSLENRIGFTIHIVNKAGTEFICNVSLPILESLTEEEKEIVLTEGSLKQELTSVSTYRFLQK